jgi:hypothetical protein
MSERLATLPAKQVAWVWFPVPARPMFGSEREEWRWREREMDRDMRWKTQREREMELYMDRPKSQKLPNINGTTEKIA